MTATEISQQLADHGPCAVGSPAQVLQYVPLSSAGKALVSADANGAELLRRLIQADLEIDALRLLPYLLPVRQAVWWGCMCSWLGNGGAPAPLEDESLRAAVAWVRRPGEAEWRAAEVAANADGCESAGGCCAQAVAWAGFRGPDRHWTHRDLNVAARLVAGSALTVLGPLKSAQGPRRLITLSVEVARGLHSWDDAPRS